MKHDLPCPKCKHHSVFGMLDVDEQQATCDEKLAKHDTAVVAFNSTPKSTRSGKAPSKPQRPVQQFGCFCHKQHCNSNTKGTGCFHCQKIVSLGEALQVGEHSDGHRHCDSCDICNCACSMDFKETERQKTATEMLLENQSADLDAHDPAGVGKEFGSSVVSILKTAQMVSSNLNKSLDPDDLLSAASSELAHAELRPLAVDCLQKATGKPADKFSNGASVESTQTLNVDSRCFRNNLSNNAGAASSMSLPSSRTLLPSGTARSDANQVTQSALEFDEENIVSMIDDMSSGRPRPNGCPRAKCSHHGNRPPRTPASTQRTTMTPHSSTDTSQPQGRTAPQTVRVPRRALNEMAHATDSKMKRKQAMHVKEALDPTSSVHKATSVCAPQDSSQNVLLTTSSFLEALSPPSQQEDKP